MKKSLMVLLCLVISCYLIAQDAVRQKEIGLVSVNLNDFGLTFKTGTDKSLWRFNTLFISGNNQDQTADSSVNNQNNIGFGIKLGKEYRKEVAENLELRLGADISFTYSQSKSDFDDKTVNDNSRYHKQTTYNPGINLVFGLNYILNDNFVLGAELLPNFIYTTGKSVEKNYYTNNGNEVKNDISGFSYGLSNTSVLLSFVYRF